MIWKVTWKQEVYPIVWISAKVVFISQMAQSYFAPSERMFSNFQSIIRQIRQLHL